MTMIDSASRRWVRKASFVVATILTLTILVGWPALRARQTLYELEKAEQPKECQNASARIVGRLDATSVRQHKDGEAGPQHAQGDQGREGLNDGVVAVDCNVDLANRIAIESLRSSNATTFVAFVVGVATILGVGVAVIAGRTAERASFAQVVLIPALRNHAGRVELVLENGGNAPLWMISLAVDAAVLQAARNDGLLRLDPSGSVDFALSLAGADGRCVSIISSFQDALGRLWKMDARLCRRSGVWYLDEIVNRACY